MCWPTTPTHLGAAPSVLVNGSDTSGCRSRWPPALLTVNSDDSTPTTNAFNWLPAGLSTTDTFSYSAVNSLGVQSNTATVNITIVSALPSQPGIENPDTGDNPYGYSY